VKVLLARPRPDPETIGLQHVMLVEPLELEVLARLCHSRAEPVVYDMVLERQSFAEVLAAEKPDVVALTGYITNVPAMIAGCHEAKKQNQQIVTVVGGVHCEVCPEDLDDSAVDFRVVRNANNVFPALLDHVQGRGPLPAGVLRPGESIATDELPPFEFRWVLPDRSTTQRYRRHYFYIFHDRVALIKTAFGCPFKCNFCFCREITGHRYHERPLEEVLDELAAIEEREIYIVDDDFLASEKRVRSFVEGVKERGIDKHYLLYGRADFVARNRDTMAEFKAVGLRTVIVGFESFLEGELEQYDKRVDLATNEAAMHVLNELGIDCYATLILHPDWGKEEFRKTCQRMRALKIKNVNLQPLTPLPKTGQQVDDKDLVLARRDFAKWDLAHVTLRPTKLQVSEYYRQLIRLYMKTLYRLRYLFGYFKYPLKMIWKMIVGTRRVRKQYLKKMAEARRLERAAGKTSAGR